MKKKWRLLSFVLVFSMALSFMTVFAGMMTFAADAIEIGTAEELRKIGLNEAYPLSADYVLTADIDLSDAEWYGIGWNPSTSKHNYFTGNFDGQGHVISGMHYGTETTAKAVEELWAFIPQLGSAGGVSTVKNLVFKDVFFNGYKTGSYSEIAAVVGYSKYNAVIENVAVLNGTLRDNGSRQVRVGGILGAWNGNGPSITIRNCYNGADIEGNYGTSGSNRYVSVAGIVGAVNNKNVTVEACVNTGTIRTHSEYHPATNGSYSGAGAIVSRGTDASGTLPSGCSVTGCYAVDGCVISSDPAALSTRDASGTQTVAFADSGNPDSYPGLGEAWTLQTGYYPIPAAIDASNAMRAPIAIATAQQLCSIGADAAYPADADYMLTADIDLSEVEWTPLNDFYGTFNGNGYRIINMHSGTESTPADVGSVSYSWGLFQSLYGTVKNLAFENVRLYVTNSNTTANTNSAVGAVCGYIRQTATVENVAVLSGVLYGTEQHQMGVGGIAGGTASGDSGWLIKDCYNGATVIAKTMTRTTGSYAAAAGMIGRAWTKAGNSIVNCVNIGQIKAINAGTKSTTMSLAGHIISSQSGDVERLVTRSGNYGIAGTLSYEGDYAGTLTDDANKTNVVSTLQAADPATFSALGSFWTLQEGYYPMLSLYASDAVAIDWNLALDDAVNAVAATNYLTEADVVSMLADLGCQGASVQLSAFVPASETADGSVHMHVTLADGTEHDYDKTIPALPVTVCVFDREEAGVAQGNATFSFANGFAEGNYGLYWGTSEGFLSGYAPLAEMGDFTVGTDVLTYNFPALCAIPAGATRLWLTVNGVRVHYYEIPASRLWNPGSLKYTYGLVSDMHFGGANASDAFTKAMDLFTSQNAAFMVHAGDITNGGLASQYKILTDAYAAGGWNIPLWTCLGNHDILAWNRSDSITAAQGIANVKAAFPTYANASYTQDANGNAYTVTVSNVNPDYDYTVAFGDDLFIYLGIGAFSNENNDKNIDQHLDMSQIIWLRGVLQENAARYAHVYLIFHYYTLESGFGIRSNDASNNGTEWSVKKNDFMTGWVSSEELFNVLKNYPNVIHLSGHTHWAFEMYPSSSLTLSTYNPVNGQENFVRTDASLGHTAIRIPSLRVTYEGYLVSVYEEGVLLTGYNFSDGQILPYATFFVPNEQLDIPAKFPVQISKDEADTVAETDTVASFEIAGVQVRTADPAGIRFVARMSTSLLDELKTLFGADNVSYGILLQKTANTGAELTEANVTGGTVGSGSAVLVPGAYTFRTYDDYLYYTAVITGMPASEYDTQITARAYVKCGDTYYFATEADGSTYAVAGAAANAGGYSVSLKQAAQHIVSNQLESWEAVQALYGDILD